MKERDRLAALGSMAAGLAHEVKNPLGAIKGAAQLLEEVGAEPPDDPASQEFVGIILEEVNRLDRVVGSFLDYARPHAGNPIPLDLNAAVRRTVQIVSSQITDGGIDVQLELGRAPAARAQIDPEKFRQVLINLLQNAIQAMDGHGKVTVTHADAARRGAGAVPSVDASPPQPPPSRRPRRGRRASSSRSSVRDTGPGIAPKVLRTSSSRSSRRRRRAPASGWPSARASCRTRAAPIEVHSQPGAGTTFTIVLPIADGSLATPLPLPPSSPPPPPAAEEKKKRTESGIRNGNREVKISHTWTNRTGAGRGLGVAASSGVGRAWTRRDRGRSRCR